MTKFIDRLGSRLLGSVLPAADAGACSTLTGSSCGPCTFDAVCTISCPESAQYSAYEINCYGQCVHVAVVCGACPPNKL